MLLTRNYHAKVRADATSVKVERRFQLDQPVGLVATMNVKWILATVAAFGLSGEWGAAVTMDKAGDGVVIENARLRATIDPHGGRIASLIIKPSGKDLISLWTRGGELGGALDGRLTFTAIAYRMALEKASGDTAVLRMDVSSQDGIVLRKTTSVCGDEPILRADYELSNGTQVPQVLWVRNFFMPGGPPLDERLSYALPLKSGLTTLPVAAEMYEDLSAPWAAMFNKATREGLVAAVPGLQKFYFWQGSKLWPTLEWIAAPKPREGGSAFPLPSVVRLQAL
jgi:hypothetical protein